MQATGVAPSKIAMQEWQKCMSWAEVFKWHATYTPWISDTNMIKKHYEKVLDDLGQQINQINPQLEEQIQLKKKNDIEEENVIKKKLRELQEAEDQSVQETNKGKIIEPQQISSLVVAGKEQINIEKQTSIEQKQNNLIEEEEFQQEKISNNIIQN